MLSIPRFNRCYHLVTFAQDLYLLFLKKENITYIIESPFGLLPNPIIPRSPEVSSILNSKWIIPFYALILYCIYMCP